MRQNPADALARSFRAYLYARLGDREKAETDIEDALNMSRKSFNVRWMAIQTYEVFEEHDRALDLLQDVPQSMFFQIEQFPDLQSVRLFSGYKQSLASRKTQSHIP